MRLRIGDLYQETAQRGRAGRASRGGPPSRGWRQGQPAGQRAEGDRPAARAPPLPPRRAAQGRGAPREV